MIGKVLVLNVFNGWRKEFIVYSLHERDYYIKRYSYIRCKKTGRLVYQVLFIPSFDFD